VSAVGRQGKTRVLRGGEVLMRKGEAGADCFAVLEGRLDIVVNGSGANEVTIGTVQAGDVVGEIATLAGDGRSATIRAAIRSKVRQLPVDAVRAAVAADPDLAAELTTLAVERLRQTLLVEHLSRLFPDVPADAVSAIGALAVWVSLRAGDQLVAQGDPAEDAFIVVSGRLRAVHRADGGPEVTLGEMAAGELVGEMALVAGSRRAASMYAVRDTHLVRLTRAAFEDLMQQFPQAGLKAVAAMLARGRRQLPVGTNLSVVVVPVTERADSANFIEQVTAHLGSDARRITSSVIDDELGVPGISQSGDDTIGSVRVAYWLEETAARTALLILEIDDEWTPWTYRALRSADRVLLVADARDDPTPSTAERRLWGELADHLHPEVRLVLVHPSTTELPSGTTAWLEPRDVTAHHHVRQGDEATYRRAARLIGGTGTSVVFGGGGPRGFAHLGVLQVLHDLGGEIDMVGGTSIGAIMAIGPAMGWSIDRMRETASAHFDKVADYTLPAVSLLRGQKITARLRANLGDIDIADLWLPYFCVSTNLTHPGTVIHDRGPLVQALRASIAIPGVLPPVPYGDSLLVDGGVLDNVPVHEMRRRNTAGRIVAVDIAPIEGPTAGNDYGLEMSGFRAWRGRRRGDGPPSLATTLMRSSLVASIRDRNRAVSDDLVDLYIHIPLHHGGRLDFSGGSALADSAAALVRPEIERWLRGDSKERYVTLTPPTGPVGATTRRRGRLFGVMLLTLRDLQYRAVRFAAVVGGTAVVLALLFLMTGLVEQFHREPRETVRSFGAGSWILREGASGAFTSGATIDGTAAIAVGDPGAAPVVTARHAMRAGPGSAPQDIVVVGYLQERLGEPRVHRGQLPRSPSEIVVDESAEVGIGDTALIGSSQYKVVGTTQGTTMFAGMPLVFMRIEAAQALLYRGANNATAVLVRDAPASLPPGLASMPAPQVAEDALRPLHRSISSVNIIRLLLWFVAALIVGTMVYLSALERTGDVAVLKAVGASTRQMVVSIALQAVLVALVAALAAAVMQKLLVPVFPLHVSVPSRALYQVPAIAVVVALVAGAFGLRKAVKVDPALAFAGAGS